MPLRDAPFLFRQRALPADNRPFHAVQPSFHGGDPPFPPDTLTLPFLETPCTRRKGASTRRNRTRPAAPRIRPRRNRIPAFRNRTSQGVNAAVHDRNRSSQRW